MLSGLSNRIFIPRKEGVPSWPDARRVLPSEGQGQTSHEERPDIRFDELEGKPGPARHSARAKAADEWATSPNVESLHRALARLRVSASPWRSHKAFARNSGRVRNRPLPRKHRYTH